MEKSFPGCAVGLKHLKLSEQKWLWEMWVQYGGSRHGPNVETVTMPLDDFWRFLDTLMGPSLFNEGDERADL